jgi:uncharacterized protein YpuA (DUF1002 family)
MDDLNGIYKIITGFSNVQRWELHQFAPLSKKAKEIRESLEINEADFRKAVEEIDNNMNIIISPKENQRKLNFTYLDFNGDFIKIINGVKSTIFNINGLTNAELEKNISQST